MKRHLLLVSTALAAWLALAGPLQAAPAPVINMGVEPAARNGVVEIKPGDTIEGIAALYRLSILEIAELNNLRKPYHLVPGTRLALPMPHSYKVKALDTLYSISRMYGVPVKKLADENNLKPPFALRLGQVLHIPSRDTEHPVSAPAAETLHKRSPAAQEAAAPEAPQDTQPETPGHVRLLKKPGPSIFTSMVSKIAGDDRKTKDPFKPSPLMKLPDAPPPASVVVDSRRPGFIWPVRGQVISSYGPKDGGLYNDGINIAAPRGTPVLAAADGTVAYVGHTLQSYGNLVLIRHGGGMITAYAHMNSVAVREGTSVRRGQPIGSVGSTGTVAHAQLHFEVRHGTDTIDPRQYLG